jgi:hypothetical protein
LTLASAAGELDILNKIKEVPGIDVQEGEYTADSFVPKVDANKMFKPYALIKFNGAFPWNDSGIVGPQYDTLRASFSVYIVSPTDRVSRKIRDDIRIKLMTNWHPTDGSLLSNTSGLSFIDTDLGYNRYVHVVGFSYLFNLS